MHSDLSICFSIVPSLVIGLVAGVLYIWAGIEMIRTPIWIQDGPFFYQMIAKFMHKWGPDREHHELDYRYPAEDVRRVGRWYIVFGSLFEIAFVAILISELTGG